jgi:hypothetical protein
MPVPKLRTGNIYVERANFSKTHGATPTQCKMTFEAVANVALGSDVTVKIGESVWTGRVLENVVHKSEGVGQVTELTCLDNRDFLMSQTTFCQLNQIDHKTGQIYCILDDAFVDALQELGYITQSEADEEYGKWETLQAFGKWNIIYPQTVIKVLCYLVGFQMPVLSTQARTILNASATALNQGIPGTLMATNNFFGLDWQMGEKVGSALTAIAELMGLQFTLVPEHYQLAFYKIGERSYTDIEWQGVFAEETTAGNALQTQVDTGVWILGERDVWQLDQVDLVPAWNQLWNRWGLRQEQWIFEHILKPAGLDLFSTTIGDLRDAGSNPGTERYVMLNFFCMDEDGTDIPVEGYRLDLTTLYDDGFTDAGYFEDLSIHDYLERVFFKVFRIGIMNELLSPSEFCGYQLDDNGDPMLDADGRKIRCPVRFKPIHTPLLSDPSVPYHCYGTTVNKKSKRHEMELSVPKTRQEKGHRMSDETGHVVFDTMQFTISETAKEYGRNNQGVLPPPDLNSIPENIIPDAPAIDVCIYGPVYRKFFGNDLPFVDSTSGTAVSILPRIGNKKVSGLRRGKSILADRADVSDPDSTPWGNLNMTLAEYMVNQDEYLLNPTLELYADTQAALVAASWLNRPQVIRSGQEQFSRIAGHEPDGQIRRVTVSLDPSRGISETVVYANDYPSLYHEPDIALTRQISVDSAIRTNNRLKEIELRAQYKTQNEADARDEGKGEGMDIVHQKRVVVNNHLEVGLAETIMVLRGEPVVIATAESGKEFGTVPAADITDKDKRAHGIAMASTAYHPHADDDGNYGRLNVVTSGMVPALVMGPCSPGDSLCLGATDTDKARWSSTGKYLVKGAGAFVALEALAAPGATPTPKMIWIKVGGAGGENTSIMVVAIASTANLPLEGYSAVDNWEPAEGNYILAKDQTNPADNGVYEYNSDSAKLWSFIATPDVAFVIGGDTNKAKTYYLTEIEPITYETQAAGAYRVKAASTTNLTLSGAQTIDGIVCNANDLVLCKNQATASQNGVYKVAAGAWVKLAQPDQVFVISGTLNSKLTYWITATNTYAAAGAAYI